MSDLKEGIVLQARSGRHKVQYGDEVVTCFVRGRLKKERLLFFHHNLVNYPLLSKLPINWLFNANKAWRLLMERFQFLGFDEIYYELEVVK